MMTDRTMVYIGLFVLIIGVLVLLALIVFPPDTPVVSRVICYHSPQDEVFSITSRYSPQKLKLDEKIVKLVEDYVADRASIKYPSLPKKVGVTDPFIGK